MKYTKHLITVVALLSLGFAATPISAANLDTYQNIELMQPNGNRLRETPVRVVFDENVMRVVSRSNGTVIKEWNYTDIKAAEYSYTKSPRWKTGLGMGAAGVLFPPLLLIAIPVAFTKHRRHWVTIRTGDDFAVLKVGKGVRKVFMPAFETRTSVQIKALGDDK